jgi:hypothetical protein
MPGTIWKASVTALGKFCGGGVVARAALGRGLRIICRQKGGVCAYEGCRTEDERGTIILRKEIEGELGDT